MPSKWIDHVKSYASKNKMSYRDALKCPKCKESYKSSGKGITMVDIPVSKSKPKKPVKPIGKKSVNPMPSGEGLRAIARKMHGKGTKANSTLMKGGKVPVDKSPKIIDPELGRPLTNEELGDIGREVDRNREEGIRISRETLRDEIQLIEMTKYNLLTAVYDNIVFNSNIYNALNYGLVLTSNEIQTLKKTHEKLTEKYEYLMSINVEVASMDDVDRLMQLLNSQAHQINGIVRPLKHLENIYNDFLDYVEERNNANTVQETSGGKIPVDKSPKIIDPVKGRPLTPEELDILAREDEQRRRQARARERLREVRERTNMQIEDVNALHTIDIDSELQRLQQMMNLLQNYRLQGRSIKSKQSLVEGGSITLKEIAEFPDDIINHVILKSLDYNSLMNLYNSLTTAGNEFIVDIDPARIQRIRQMVVENVERLRSQSPPASSKVRQRTPSPLQKNKKQRTSPLSEIEMPAFAFAAPAPSTPTSTSSSESGGKIKGGRIAPVEEFRERNMAENNNYIQHITQIQDELFDFIPASKFFRINEHLNGIIGHNNNMPNADTIAKLVDLQNKIDSIKDTIDDIIQEGEQNRAANNMVGGFGMKKISGSGGYELIYNSENTEGTSGGKIHKNANSYVQSIVFDKSKFDKKTASAWLKKNNYENKGADDKENTIRYRQVNPQYIEKMGFDKFRTKKIGKNSGISLILAYK